MRCPEDRQAPPPDSPPLSVDPRQQPGFIQTQRIGINCAHSPDYPSAYGEEKPSQSREGIPPLCSSHSEEEIPAEDGRRRARRARSRLLRSPDRDEVQSLLRMSEKKESCHERWVDHRACSRCPKSGGRTRLCYAEPYSDVTGNGNSPNRQPSRYEHGHHNDGPRWVLHFRVYLGSVENWNVN